MNKKARTKMLRILLSVFVIPTLVFVFAAACHCPMAWASSNELVFKNPASCCCPEGNKCDAKSSFVSKDEVVNVQAFEIEKLVSHFQVVSQHTQEVLSPSFTSSIFQFSEASPPSISHLATVQLLI